VITPETSVNFQNVACCKTAEEDGCSLRLSVSLSLSLSLCAGRPSVRPSRPAVPNCHRPCNCRSAGHPIGRPSANDAASGSSLTHARRRWGRGSPLYWPRSNGCRSDRVET
jgi:hypothetical protein